ncbi:MAG: hypothetical protein ACRC8K_15020 [Waterburya sp.]
MESLLELKYLWPSKGEAVFYRNVGLWLDGECRCNIVLANVKGVKEPWAVITDEAPTLETLWQYGLRFRVEELFLDSIGWCFSVRGISNSRSLCSRTFIFSHCISYTICYIPRYGSSTHGTENSS